MATLRVITFNLISINTSCADLICPKQNDAFMIHPSCPDWNNAPPSTAALQALPSGVFGPLRCGPDALFHPSQIQVIRIQKGKLIRICLSAYFFNSCSSLNLRKLNGAIVAFRWWRLSHGKGRTVCSLFQCGSSFWLFWLGCFYSPCSSISSIR